MSIHARCCVRLVVAAGGLLAGAPQAWSQGDGDSDSAAAPLATKQEIIRDRVLRLEDQMFRLSETLREQDPQQAARLEKALRRMGELAVRHDLKELIDLLSKEARYSEAASRQQALLEKYGALLTLLMQEEDDAAKRQEDLERLEKALEQLKEIIGKQGQLRDQSQDAEQAAEQLQSDPEAAAAIRAVLEQQQELAKKTAAALESGDPAAAEKLAASQEALQQMAGDLANILAGEKREQAAAGEVRAAAQSMKSAHSAMGEQQLGVASDFQEDAIQDLERALEKLSKKQPAGAEPPPWQEMTTGQEQVHKETGELSEKMLNGGDPHAGDPHGGEPTPGQANVDLAAQHMQTAGQQLAGHSGSGAKGEQEHALEHLDQAKQQLEQAIRELKAQEQKKKLEDLEKRLKDMLTRQLGINRATLALHELGPANWRRPEQLQLADQSRAQQELGDAAEQCLTILREDNTTTVFPQLIEDVRDDMQHCARLLNDGDVGLPTQEIQDEIVETLENLLAIIEEVQNQPPAPPSPSPPQNCQANNDPPLLPSSAELKMLRNLEERLLGRTQSYGRHEFNLEAARRLADKQKDVAVMTTKMAERLQRRN